jgi:hypothetical protein
MKPNLVVQHNISRHNYGTWLSFQKIYTNGLQALTCRGFTLLMLLVLVESLILVKYVK